MDFSSAIDLVDDIRDGRREVSEVVEECFRRIEELDPELNAFLALNEEDALEKAKKIDESGNVDEMPLAGLPIAVKDNEETEGLRTTYGSKLYEDFVPEEDSVLVERLENAGAIIVGKTNLPEFGLISYTDNQLMEPTLNPWNLDKTVGGSSGGSAAAVASEITPVATGSDSGGSIRIPASFCNLYGLKPTFWRVPTHPKKPIFVGLHTKGFITRSVEDTAYLLDLAAGRDRKDMNSLPEEQFSYLNAIERPLEESDRLNDVKIAFSSDLGYATVEPAVEEIVRSAVFDFEEFGEVEEVEIDAPNLESELIEKVGSEVITMMGEKMEDWKEVAYPPLLTFLTIAESVEADEYISIEERVRDFWSSLRPIYEEFDFLVTPTVAVPPFEIGDIGPNKIDGENVSPLGWMAFTYPFNFTRQPAASVPAGFTDDELPVGMQIVGEQFDDLGVLKISKAYQQVNPWQDKRPELISSL